jgi:lipopolysaccharide transport system ATP-binding protein
MVDVLNRNYQEQSSASEEDVVLSVNHVSKRFCRDLKRSLLYGVQDITTDLLGVRKESDVLRPKEFWALHDVNFQLRRGEALGLVGKNGSGKSTLLRIITGLIKPDSGSVEVKGRLAPLIALGAGFSPVLTGRENIYANMSILGLSKKEISQRFDEVVAFAEIEDAIDSPVHSYSSGMAARLGFACAIHTDPDILLIDEVLAVGDSRFRAKCFRKLHELRTKNTTFILVSHESHTILTVCKSAVYLNKGRMLGQGETASVMRLYEEELFSERNTGASPSQSAYKQSKLGDSNFDIASMFFRDAKGNPIEEPISGEKTELCLECHVTEELNNVGITVSVKGLADGGQTILLLNCIQDKKPLRFSPGKYEVRLSMPHLGLKYGQYLLDVYAKAGLYHLDMIEEFPFKVQEKGITNGRFYQNRDWLVLRK